MSVVGDYFFIISGCIGCDSFYILFTGYFERIECQSGYCGNYHNYSQEYCQYSDRERKSFLLAVFSVMVVMVVMV